MKRFISFLEAKRLVFATVFLASGFIGSILFYIGLVHFFVDPNSGFTIYEDGSVWFGQSTQYWMLVSGLLFGLVMPVWLIISISDEQSTPEQKWVLGGIIEYLVVLLMSFAFYAIVWLGNRVTFRGGMVEYTLTTLIVLVFFGVGWIILDIRHHKKTHQQRFAFLQIANLLFLRQPLGSRRLYICLLVLSQSRVRFPEKAATMRYGGWGL